jgi:hypothetical protein
MPFALQWLSGPQVKVAVALWAQVFETIFCLGMSLFALQWLSGQ